MVNLVGLITISNLMIRGYLLDSFISVNSIKVGGSESLYRLGGGILLLPPIFKTSSLKKIRSITFIVWGIKMPKKRSKTC